MTCYAGFDCTKNKVCGVWECGRKQLLSCCSRTLVQCLDLSNELACQDGETENTQTQKQTQAHKHTNTQTHRHRQANTHTITQGRDHNYSTQTTANRTTTNGKHSSPFRKKERKGKERKESQQHPSHHKDGQLPLLLAGVVMFTPRAGPTARHLSLPPLHTQTAHHQIQSVHLQQLR